MLTENRVNWGQCYSIKFTKRGLLKFDFPILNRGNRANIQRKNHVKSRTVLIETVLNGGISVLSFKNDKDICFVLSQLFWSFLVLGKTSNLIWIANFLVRTRNIDNIYRTRAIISRGLYNFLPHFQRPFMYCDLWPYVWLVFKSGF